MLRAVVVVALWPSLLALDDGAGASGWQLEADHDHDHDRPVRQVERRRELSRDEFVDRYVAQGVPVVVTDATAAWPAPPTAWSLAALRKRFGAEQVQNRQLDPGEPLFGEHGEFLGRMDFESEAEWAEFVGGWEDADAESLNLAWQVRNATTAAALQTEYYRLPYPFHGFQQPGVYVSEHGASETVFFAFARGEGREPHIDHSCMSAWSAQVRGRKRWRLWAPHSEDGVLVQDLAFHGVELPPAAQARLSADAHFEAVLEPGDVIVWYPGWTHATEALDNESVALSVEFDLPLPVGMLEEHADLFELHSKAFGSYTRCFPAWRERARAQAALMAATKDEL